MAQPLSDYLGVRPRDLERFGVLDSVIGVDTNLFVDPHLLHRSVVPEFAGSDALMEDYFADVLTTLQRSRVKDDQHWREARNRMVFPELRGVSIGYSATRGDGNAIGPVLANKLIETASKLIRLGAADPAIFELMGLFESGFGADRLSDMTLCILKNKFYWYSARITRELRLFGVGTFSTSVGRIELPRHPNGRDPLLFLPRDLLSELPVAFAFGGIDLVIGKNREVRRQINRLVGRAWRRSPAVTKRHVLLSNPAAVRALVRAYKRERRNPYDVKRDPSGLIRWYNEGRRVATAEPLRLRLPVRPNVSDLVRTVESIIRRFKRIVEKGNLPKTLGQRTSWFKSRPRERYVQRLFYSIAAAYCAANNLAVRWEPDSGDGSIRCYAENDTELKVVIDVKLSSNRYLSSNFLRVLASSSTESLRRFYVIVRITKAVKGMSAVKRLWDQHKRDRQGAATLVTVDARGNARD